MSDDATIADLARTVNFELPGRYNASRLLWDNLEHNAGNAAVLSDAGTWTYAELAAEAARIGNALVSSGAGPGDRILLFMDDEPAYPAAIMGALRAGLVPMLINTLSPPEMVRFYLEDSQATVAVVSPAFADLFSAEQTAGSACRSVLVASDAPPWCDAPVTLDETPTARGDMAFWMYSSGSTGKPKGVVHRHEDAAYTARTYSDHVLNLRPGDICYSVPKIFFAYGFGNSVTFPFAAGAAAVLAAGRPEPASIFAGIERHRPTVFFGLPTLYTALARHEAAKMADLSSIRLCISAAEVLSADIAAAWKARFGHDIVEGLGSTEVLHIYLSNDEARRRAGSAGRAVPGYAIKLETPEGKPARPGEEGVMSVLGLSSARHYWNRPDKSAETMRGGWIYTGDRFVRDGDGFYFFKGRADDLVKVSGQWVYPLEIELALNEHPKVHECCVQAVELKDRRLTLKAWVTPAQGVAGDEALSAELKAYAKQALLPHKYPREIVYLESLPKTGTGKIDRQALRRSRAP